MTIPFLGNLIGGVFVFTGSWLVAQATFDTVERFIGGSVILVAGILIIRWVLKTSERVEKYWTGALAAATDRAEKAEIRADRSREECDEIRKERDNALSALATERALRVSLEESGLTDRRNQT